MEIRSINVKEPILFLFIIVKKAKVMAEKLIKTLDLSKIVQQQQVESQSAYEEEKGSYIEEEKGEEGFIEEEMNYDEAMATERDANGIVKGYLAKTAQNLTMFARKQFHRRYYELNIQSKQLKIYE